MPSNYNLRSIRALLTRGFSEDELRRLCFDIPDLRSVCDELAPGMSKAQIVDRLIEHVERKLLIGVLLSYARQMNPARFGEYEPYEDPLLVYPEAPQPDVPFSSSPVVDGQDNSPMRQVSKSVSLERKDLLRLLATQQDAPTSAGKAGKLSGRRLGRGLPKIQLFLSYARTDVEQVGVLRDRLAADGFDPWMDIESILPGEKWESAVRRAIQQSDFAVVCLSSRSVNRRGFLQKEIPARPRMDDWVRTYFAGRRNIASILEDLRE